MESIMTSNIAMETLLAEATRASCLEQDQIEANKVEQTISIRKQDGSSKVLHCQEHGEVVNLMSSGYSLSKRWGYLSASMGVLTFSKVQNDSKAMDTYLVVVHRTKNEILGTIPVTYAHAPILDVSVRECKQDAASEVVGVVIVITAEAGGLFVEHTCQTIVYDMKDWSAMHMFSKEGSMSPSLLFPRPGEVIIARDMDGTSLGPCIQTLDLTNGDMITYADCQLFGDDGDTLVYLYPSKSEDHFILVVVEYLGNRKSLRMTHVMNSETLQPVDRLPVGMAATCHSECPPLVEPSLSPCGTSLRFINRQRFGDAVEMVEYPLPVQEASENGTLEKGGEGMHGAGNETVSMPI